MSASQLGLFEDDGLTRPDKPQWLAGYRQALRDAAAIAQSRGVTAAEIAAVLSDLGADVVEMNRESLAERRAKRKAQAVAIDLVRP